MGIFLIVFLAIGVLFIVKLWSHSVVTNEGSDGGSLDSISFFNTDGDGDSDGSDGGDGGDGGGD